MNGSAEHGGYVVMQQFMIEDLGLSGDELIVYAIIFGFCQDGKSYCRCSRNYFSFWVGKSKRSVSRILDSLVERGLIVREHEYIDGQTFPRYRLGQDAPGVAIERVEVFARDGSEAVKGIDASDKGGALAHPPCHGDSDVSAAGRGVRQRTPLVTSAPPVTNWQADTDTDSNTDTDTDTESDGAKTENLEKPFGEGADSASASVLQRQFHELKSHMPSTDGYGYAYDNFCALRRQGFSFEEVVRAADLLTQAIRADYPDRPARFLPHAERLLDLGNPQGIGRFLDKKRVDAAKVPDDRKLFIFAMTSDLGDLSWEAERLNAEVVHAKDDEAKRAARKERDAWFEANRDTILSAWRLRKEA